MKILKNLFKTFFFPSDTITFYSLYKKLKAHSKTNTYPNDYTLPPHISFPSDFWKQVIRLYKDTLADKHERSVSIFLWEQEYIFATVIKGDKSKVNVRGKVKVAYELKNKKPPYTFYRKIWVDEKVYSQKEVSQKQVPSKIDPPIYLFHLHTHPPHDKDEGYQIENTNIGGDYVGKYGYSYWSAQDIKSFVLSGTAMTGLITDKFRLLVRTDKTPSSFPKINDYRITPAYLQNELNLVEYEGRFNEKLTNKRTNE